MNLPAGLDIDVAAIRKLKDFDALKLFLEKAFREVQEKYKLQRELQKLVDMRGYAKIIGNKSGDSIDFYCDDTKVFSINSDGSTTDHVT